MLNLYLRSIILNSSHASGKSTCSCKYLSSWSTWWHSMFPTLSCFGILLYKANILTICCILTLILLQARWSILIPCHTVIMFTALLTLKARLEGLLVRFSDGFCWPPPTKYFARVGRCGIWLLADSAREIPSTLGKSFGGSVWVFAVRNFDLSMDCLSYRFSNRTILNSEVFGNSLAEIRVNWRCSWLR